MNKPNLIIGDPPGKTGGIFCLRTFLLTFLLVLLSPLVFSQARIKVSDPKKNFGLVKRGVVIRNEYELSNTGNEPLVITDLEIECSCTSAEYSKQPLLPGQKTNLVLVFNTASVYGRQDRIVLVKSNDPEGPTKLRFKGFVQNTK